MMYSFLVVQPIGALVAGVLILIFPGILNYIVAIYLIVADLIGIALRFLG